MSIRPIKRLVRAKPTLEGAGVHLRRAFGFGNTADFDPFLLLDDFRNDIPEDYLAGLPWHPRRAAYRRQPPPLPLHPRGGWGRCVPGWSGPPGGRSAPPAAIPGPPPWET